MDRASKTAVAAVRSRFSLVHFFACAAAACACLACELVHAQVTPLNWYRMGESDGTTIAGQALPSTIDIVGDKTLVLTNVTVQTDVGTTAVAGVGSTRSLAFAGGSSSYGNAPLLNTAVDNFGLEAWVKPTATSSGDQVIAYNGNFGFTGWGIVLKSDGKYYGQFGLAAFGGVAATIGAWTHVAMIRDSGAAFLYVNGVLAADSTTAAPSTPSTRFGVGNGAPAFTTGFQGLIDEVRAFTLVPGQFSPDQLLYSARRVSNTADSGAGSLRDALTAATLGQTIAISVTGTITLLNPLPIVGKGVTIFGPGAQSLSISGANANRVFFVASQSPVTIGDLSIVNGNAKGGAGGSATWGGGGGMGAGGGLFVNFGNVVLTRVNFTGNAATGGKGGNSTGSSCSCTGGGGGLGGAGGSTTVSETAGGGGGYLGAGGSSSGALGAGGGGGLTGKGGDGVAQTGGGGGAYTNGHNGTPATTVPAAGGAGADGVGGDGGTPGDVANGPADGHPGLDYGGGGGAAIYGFGGNGGIYAGGGGAALGVGGSGGDFGGSGGNGLGPSSPPGGFGGGSGGASQNAAGNGGFGAGSGASQFAGANDAKAGAFAGRGAFLVSGTGLDAGGGGGGAALGGAIFIRADNGATLTWNDGSADAGTVTGGAAGNTGGAGAGSAAGSSMFLLSGTTTLNVNAAQKSILGSISGWVNEPPNLTKNGTGVLTLAGGGNDLGIVTVNKGDLRLNFNALNLVAGKELDINNGGTLSGALGGINGPVKLASGGTISPGDPDNAAGVGVLNTGSLNWNGGGVIAFQLAGTGGITSDLLNITGDLTKQTGSGFNFHFADGSTAPICGTTYTVIQYTGTSNFAASDFVFTYSGAAGVSPASAFTLDSAGRKLQFTPHCYNDQAITNFIAIPSNPAFSVGGTFGITATPGGSTGTLTFGSTTPAVCTVSGGVVTLHARGACQLTADQAGDSNYNPAPTVTLTLHFEQFTVNATTTSAYGTIGPDAQTIDYGAVATFSAHPQSGFKAIVSGDTCTVTPLGGDNWTTGPITSDCNISADFSDRVFADGFD